MTTTAIYALSLAALGLPVVTGGVALVARSLVHRHADEYAATVEHAHRPATADRPKELTR